MEIKDFEDLILRELKSVVETIIKNNPTQQISANARAGAEISDFLEKQFVLKTQNHKFFKNSESSPNGATKNPWDAMTWFCINNHQELIWIDFKAIKVTGADSNPDIGTPDKIINLIKNGDFYLIYIFVYYNQTDTGITFVKNTENELVKLYFLKDINHTFRRNPKNQLQVNISAKNEYRSREDFIDLLFVKLKESYKRQIEKAQQALKKIEESKELECLKLKNKEQEDKIKKI